MHNPLPLVKIITGSIQSGKTTALMEWLNNAATTKVTGWLTPQEEYGKSIIFLPNDSKQPFAYLTPPSTADTVNIGKYYILSSALSVAKGLLSKPENASSHWFIIDEIGKLELRNQGFEPQLSKFINDYQNNKFPNLNLIVIVRDSLLDDFLLQYQIHNYMVCMM